jgi:hypothetical protein
METQRFIDACEEVSAFIGLLVIELQQYEHKFCIEGNYMDQEVSNDLFSITKKLRHIQKVLQNPIDVIDKEKILELVNYLHDTNSPIIKFQQENDENIERLFPTGYAYVIRYLCKKKIKVFENNLDQGTVLFKNLEMFFTVLGEYLNSTYFYKYS